MPDWKPGNPLRLSLQTLTGLNARETPQTNYWQAWQHSLPEFINLAGLTT
jgi:hypothetical protein